MGRRYLGAAPTDPLHLARLMDIGAEGGGSSSKARAIALLQKAAVDSAAIRGGGLRVMPNDKKPTITVLPDSGDLPTFPNYYRYWIDDNGNGLYGEGGLGRYIVGGTDEGWSPVFGGGVTFNANDGSSTVYYAPHDFDRTAVWATPCTLAFYFDGRYLAIPCRHWTWQLFVDDEIYSTTDPIAPDNGTSNGTIQLDFGSRGWRKIVFRSSPDVWLPEILCQRGDTLVPLTKEQLGLTINWAADSYGQYSSREIGGLPYLQFIGALVGARAGRENAIGGTGYATPNGGDPTTYPAIIQSERLTDINYGTPDIVGFHVGVNDAYPVSLIDGANTTAAIQLALSTTRAEHPDALLYCISPLTLSQTKAEDPAQSPQLVRNAIKSVLESIAGPWVMADSLLGKIYTSDGATLSDGDVPWFTGDGNDGAPTGEGNTDIYVGSGAGADHPSQPAGYRYLAYRVATALTKGILALQVPSAGGNGAGMTEDQQKELALPKTFATDQGAAFAAPYLSTMYMNSPAGGDAKLNAAGPSYAVTPVFDSLLVDWDNSGMTESYTRQQLLDGNVRHTYSTFGFKTIPVTISNAYGSQTSNFEVTVAAPSRTLVTAASENGVVGYARKAFTGFPTGGPAGSVDPDADSGEVDAFFNREGTGYILVKRPPGTSSAQISYQVQPSGSPSIAYAYAAVTIDGVDYFRYADYPLLFSDGDEIQISVTYT